MWVFYDWESFEVNKEKHFLESQLLSRFDIGGVGYDMLEEMSVQHLLVTECEWHGGSTAFLLQYTNAHLANCCGFHLF